MSRVRIMEQTLNVVVQGNTFAINAGGIYLSNSPNAQVDNNPISNDLVPETLEE